MGDIPIQNMLPDLMHFYLAVIPLNSVGFTPKSVLDAEACSHLQHTRGIGHCELASIKS